MQSGDFPTKMKAENQGGSRDIEFPLRGLLILGNIEPAADAVNCHDLNSGSRFRQSRPE